MSGVYVDMVDLNKDLQAYLSRNSNSKENVEQREALIESSGAKRFSATSWFSKRASSASSSFEKSWFSAETESNLSCFALSKKQRVLGFATCVVMGSVCFTLAAVYAPFLLVKARKFALLFTLGSMFMMSSFSFLWGPLNHIKYLFSSGRLPFTSVYLGSLIATLYFALEIKSTPLTVLSAVVQVLALLWFLISYIPGGQTGLKFFSKLFSTTVSKSVQTSLPV